MAIKDATWKPVQRPCSEMLKITVPARTSVAELKSCLESRAGVAAQLQRLVFAGRLLPDSEPVGEAIGYCGESGERVVLLLTAPPGNDDSGFTVVAPRGSSASPPVKTVLPISTQNRFASLALEGVGASAGSAAPPAAIATAPLSREALALSNAGASAGSVAPPVKLELSADGPELSSVVGSSPPSLQGDFLVTVLVRVCSPAT